MLSRVVWSAVASVVLGVASVLVALNGQLSLTIATGAFAIACAILSNRERR